MSPIKDKMLSVIQKLVVIILACLLGLCILPVGLIPDKEPEDTGDFLRIFAEEETYPGSISETKGVENIGNGASAYLRFNFEKLAETDANEIKSVRLRLAFLKGSGEVSNRVKISLADNKVWEWKKKFTSPSVYAKDELAVIYPQTKRAEDSLSEIDITDLAKEYIAKGKTQITINISGDMQVGAQLASGKFYDSAYRPYIKIVTGDAADTDAYTFKRAELIDAVYVSKEDPDRQGADLTGQTGAIISGDGNETYLKFELNENSIFDTVYDAKLSLYKKSGENDTNLKIYCVNNNQWSGDSVSYSAMPRGEETVAAEVETDAEGRINIDVTRAVCEARAIGIKSLTLRVSGADGEKVEFYGREDEKRCPALYIKATDDANISCAAEAALSALRVNPASFVTMDLSDSYTSGDGVSAKIRWKEYDEMGMDITGRHIETDGRVIRPKWFEKNAEVVAEARIKSGDYITSRRFYVTIPSSAAPDYSGYGFSNYIDIGDGQSEEEQKFESINVSGVKRRWTSGRMFSYRVPEADGAMVMNLACIPDSDNYITLKLWEGDKTTHSDFLLSACDEERKSIVLKAPDDKLIYEKGFVYATYRLPREFTDGKRFVSLCLSCVRPDKEKETEEGFEPRGVYAAYMTQSAFFEPKTFARQGEKSVSEPSFGEGAIRKFVSNLRAISIPVDTDEPVTEPGVGRDAQRVSLDKNAGAAVFTGDEINIAFSITENRQATQVYQKTEYYDRYCSECPVTLDGDFAIVDYGDYKMVWNMSETETMPLPYWHLEVSGAYKEAVSGDYYAFSEEWQMTDDSVIPEGEAVRDGREIFVAPGSAILLMHIAEPMHESDWRVNKINEKNVSELVFRENEKIENITVRAVGGVSDEVESASVVLAVYDNDKITAIYRKEAGVFGSVNIYTMDFSEFGVYMKKGRSIRIFVSDNTTDMTGLSPKLEMP